MATGRSALVMRRLSVILEFELLKVSIGLIHSRMDWSWKALLGSCRPMDDCCRDSEYLLGQGPAKGVHRHDMGRLLPVFSIEGDMKFIPSSKGTI
jgi:hypothetical protein